MAVDKNKIIAEATRLVQKGAYDKAIAAYQRILADDPREVRSLLKIAELFQRKGDAKAAAQAFEKVAETYAEQGFFLKAVAVYKQIVKIDPDDVRVNERLAGLYQQLGLMSDAMSQYQFMAAAYEKAGDGAKLTDVLKRMVELDPENIASSIKLGELYARSNQAPPALECFRRAADYLKKHNRADEYLKVAERICALLPGDLGLTRELANIYLAKRDTKRALAKLQLCFKAEPKDVVTLQLLAQAFRDLGQNTKTISVYKELAHVHEEHGRAQEARSVWRKVRELAPDDAEAVAATGAPSATPPPIAGAARSALTPPPRASAPPPGRPPGAAPRAPAPGPPPGALRSPAPAGPEAIPKLLSETDVYVKYGLHDKALDHLKKVLAIAPSSPEGLERARELHLAAGHPEEAGRAGALLVRALVEQAQIDRGREALSRLREIAPRHPELGELNAAVSGTEEVALGDGDVEEELVLAHDLREESEIDDDALALAAAAQDEEVVEEEEAPASAARRAPPGADDEVLAAARASAESEDEIIEEPPPPRAPDGDEEVDLSDEIEEADFFVQQGLLDEARETLQNLLAFYPGHAAVAAKLAAVERKGRPAAKAPPARALAAAAAPPSAGDASFEIARELADEIGPSGGGAVEEEFQYSVEDVFNQFKKGVEQTVKREDSATHYDLGIAYKEMGLIDDAIHEFETSLAGNDRRKEVDCLSMIGLCQLAKGDPRGAVKAFRRALASDHLSKDAAKAIHYELASAYEDARDLEAALYYFQRVSKADPAFRDTRKRAAALGGGPGRPPPEDARGSSPAPPHAAPLPLAAPARPAPPGGAPKKNIGYL